MSRTGQREQNWGGKGGGAGGGVGWLVGGGEAGVNGAGASLALMWWLGWE